MAESASRRKWVEAHRAELNAYHRVWSKANREKIRGYAAAADPVRRKERNRIKMRAWREKNPERSKASYRKAARVQNQKHPEKRVARVKAWYLAHPGAKAVIEQRREARKRNAPGNGVTRAQWAEMLLEYGGRCAYCARLADLTMDHIDPLAKGGAHDISNVAPACRNCNSQKHDNSLVLWLVKRAAA